MSIAVHHIVTGEPYVIRPSIGGLFHPKYQVPGSAMAGRVEAVGAKVTMFQAGDAVFGESTDGAFAPAVTVTLTRPSPGTSVG